MRYRFLIVGITAENIRRNDFMVGEGKGETKGTQKFLSFMSDELSLISSSVIM